ncbi:MAG TPA: FAD-dependent oxidoreductase, partial [Gillisia sp.]|nr:FAD-dependent oxidoreductase [Gillisia sp.]
MFTRSIWNAHSEKTSFSTLDQNKAVDVAIIGGGITGLTTALLLKNSGLKVAVLEAREVGRGTTGHSTGNLYVITDQLLSPIKEKYDIEVLKKVVKARGEAFRLIAENVQKLEIDCDYKLQSMFVYEDGQTDKIAEELEIAREAGLPFSEVITLNIPGDFYRGMEIPGQATFNPLLYVQGLAKNVENENCHIYENTEVREIHEEDNEVVLITTTGTITAKNVIHATHTPKGVEVQYHTVLGPYREYGIAVKLEEEIYPEGIFWGYYNKEKYSIRTYEREGEKFLLCIGNPHKVGQAEDNEEHITKLIDFLGEHFRIKEVAFKWGGQHYKPADLLPYIGRKSNSSRQFVATGYATDGLIYGTLAAQIIASELKGTKHLYSGLFKASRHSPIKAAKEFIKENVDVAAEFVKGLFTAEMKDMEDILPGEAKIIVKDNHKIAVHRNMEGMLT